MRLQSSVFVRAAVVALLSCAGAPALSREAYPAGAPRLVPVGHGDYYFNPAQKRFTGTVTAVGAPDAQGRVVSFKLAPIRPGLPPPEPNALVGWRLTMLAGQLYASAFEVRSNSETEVTVVLREGSLQGIAATDVFVIEEPDPKAPWSEQQQFDRKPS